ncbi:MAG: transglutaminase domain-containing protein [Treponema sp.]
MKHTKKLMSFCIAAAAVVTFGFVSCADAANDLQESFQSNKMQSQETERDKKTPQEKKSDAQKENKTEKPHNSAYEEKKQEFFSRILNASLCFESSASVGDLNIKHVAEEDAETEEHKALYAEFFDKHPYIFHLRENGSIGIRYKSDKKDEVNELLFEYLVDKNALEERYKEFEAGMELLYASVQEGMTEAERSYAIHAALEKKTRYDSKHFFDKFTPRGPIVLGRAVCEGYSLAYKKLMLGIGVPTQFVTGPAFGADGHMWNRIQIDGEWYNLDATWDDNDSAYYYRRAHCLGAYFLTSDAQFHGVLSHLVPDLQYRKQSLTSTKYDGNEYVFRNRGHSKGELSYRGGYWYYFSFPDATIYKSRFDGSEKQAIYKKTYQNETETAGFDTQAKKDMQLGRLGQMELGKTKIYFIDLADANVTGNYALYSMDFDGAGVQKLYDVSGFIPSSLTPDGDKPVPANGIEALKAEVMLSKMKDAYFHGTETFEKPVSGERVQFINLIKDAETLIRENPHDTAGAAALYEKLRNFRKNYTMPRTRRA